MAASSNAAGRRLAASRQTAARRAQVHRSRDEARALAAGTDKLGTVGFEVLVQLWDACACLLWYVGLCARRSWSCALRNLRASGGRVTRADCQLAMGVLLSGWLLAAFFGGWLVLYHVLVGASSIPRSSHPLSSRPLSSHPLSSRPRSLPKCCCRCHRPLHTAHPSLSGRHLGPRRAAPPRHAPPCSPSPLPPLPYPPTPFLPQAGDAVLAQSQDGATPRLLRQATLARGGAPLSCHTNCSAKARACY